MEGMDLEDLNLLGLDLQALGLAGLGSGLGPYQQGLNSSNHGNLTSYPVGPAINLEDVDLLELLGFKEHPAFSITSVCMGLVGILSNGFALVVFLMSRDLRSRLITMFLVNQALANLLASLMIVVNHATRMSIGGKAVSTFYCKAVRSEFLSSFFLAASMLNLPMLTVELLLKVVYPIFHLKHFGKKAAVCMLPIPWLIALLQSFPFLTAGHVILNTCFPGYVFNSPRSQEISVYLELLLVYILPLLFVVGSYSHMIAVLRRKVKVKVAASLSSANQKSDKTPHYMSRAQANLFRTMLVLTVLVLICWTPLQVYYFRYSFGSVSREASTDLHLIVGRALAGFSCIINTFVYAAQYKAFKVQARKLLTCNCGPQGAGQSATRVTNAVELSMNTERTN